MNLDPQKFFIGLMDFFSIWLPGALLTYLLLIGEIPLMSEVPEAVLSDRYANLAGAEAWTVFLFASYLFGHLIFQFGSWLDLFYDWARRYTLNTQITLLARRGRLLPKPARALIWLVFKHERDLAVDRVVKLKEQALDTLRAKDAINAFQWCKVLLNTESPESLTVVQRFEADSKFFRSFTVVLLLLFILCLWQWKSPLFGVLVIFVLLLLALWRYMEQRFKATNHAYWAIITLTAKDGKLALGNTPPETASPPHAGGVVFRMRGGIAQYLLVEAKDDPAQWVLPKGHVEEGEQHRDAAVREVHEEAGVWARIGVLHPKLSKHPTKEREEVLEKRRKAAELGDESYLVKGKPVTVRFYLMEAVGYGFRKDKCREHLWLPLEEAIARATHPETRYLLQLAEARRQL